jgi:transcriptional regulator with XRE-family HTH domain
MLDALSGWLREQRLARGWSVAEMGRQLRQAAKTTGDHTIPGAAILTSYVRRWEAGKIAPTERYRLHYCTAFRIPPAQFGPDPPQPQEPTDSVAPLPTERLAADILLAAPAAQARAALAGWTGEPSGYRDARTGYTTAERTEQPQPAADSPDLWMTMIAEESLDFGEWADTSNIGDATLEHYAAQVRQLASDYQHAAPYPLLLETKRLRDRVFGKLQGHQRPGQTRDLYLIAAQVCGLLAWMSGDMGYQRAADSHAWTGWVCAEQANHDGARTWIRATQSKLAYWDDRYLESAQLADDGLRYLSADSGHAMLALLHARALARLGRNEEAGEALAGARTRLEQAGPDEVGGLWGVSQARYHHLTGSTHLWRQDPGQVLAETRQALELFEVTPAHQRYYGAEVGTRIDEAQAHLLSHDIDGAHASLRPVLTLAPENRNEPLTQHLGHVRRALADPAFRNAALARELQEEIETYSRESIVHDLRD